MPVPDCLAVVAVVPDCLDSPAGHPQDCLAMPSPDCLAAAVARLDGGGGDRRWHVCEMDTAYIEQRLRNMIYLYVEYNFLDMGLDTDLNRTSSV
jgi:hypothetical protein